MVREHSSKHSIHSLKSSWSRTASKQHSKGRKQILVSGGSPSRFGELCSVCAISTAVFVL